MPGLLVPPIPLAELDELRSRIERAYDQWFDGQDRAWMPAIDVERDEKHLTVRADIPGSRQRTSRSKVKDGILTISGEQEQRTEKHDKAYLRRERRYGAFSRSMSLPARVDPSKIKATTKDGVVEDTIPLPAEPRRTRSRSHRPLPDGAIAAATKPGGGRQRRRSRAT
jgi:HSP20 family protein